MRAQFTLTTELTTPAFIGGVEPRKVDKFMPIRPSSVRGMLRWWFRAGAAALLWPRDRSRDQTSVVSALRNAESCLFGDTKAASTVVILPPEGGNIREMRALDPAQYPGVLYLGYGLFDHRNGTPEALQTTPAIPLRLTLGLRRDIAGARELLGATTWLWIALGGLGARTRRGFGSMVHIAGGESLGWPSDLVTQADGKDALADQVLLGLEWATNVFREHLPRLTSHPLENGDGPLRELRTIDGIGGVAVLAVDALTGLDALESAGRLFRDFRGTLQRRRLGLPPLPDYFAVKTAIQSRRPPSTLDRAAFGLPLPFYFRSLGGAKASFAPEGGDRLASPLIFRVKAVGRGADRRYVVLLVNLGEANGASPLLGQRVGAPALGGAFAAPDGKLISQFIHWAMAEAVRAPSARGRKT